jgi:hypothetical protein
MKKPIVIGALAVAAFVVAVIYLRKDAAGSSTSTTPSAQSERSASTAASSTPTPTPTSAGAPAAAITHAQPSLASSDPSLASLSVSPDNGLIEFVRTPDGKVIAEIDKDPNSPGFQKRSREYFYSGEQVMGVTAYRYFADHVEVSRTRVSYKPDGSVDRLDQSTSIESTLEK